MDWEGAGECNYFFIKIKYFVFNSILLQGMEGLIVTTGKGLSRNGVGFVVFVKWITLDRSDIKVSHDVSEAPLSFFLPDLTHCNDVLNFYGGFLLFVSKHLAAHQCSPLMSEYQIKKKTSWFHM